MRSIRLVSATARGAPIRMPSHSAATVAGDVVGDVGDQPDVAGQGGVERLAGEERRGEPAAARPAQDRHGDDRRGDPDADLGEGEREVALHDDEVARRHQPDATGAGRAVDGGDRRHVGVHQPAQGAHDRRRVRRAGAPLLEVGAGAERRRDVGQHDRPHGPVGDTGLGDVERRG